MKNAALLLGLGALFASCRPGAPAEAVRPTPPTGAQALEEDKPAECRPTSKYVEPLVVDWKSNARTDLELAMKDGVAVVKYDCGSFELLKSCRVKGGYTFASVSRKEDTVQIVGRDELAANLPLGAASLGAQLARGSSIDIALVTVGKQRTNVDRVARPELTGDCDGATHFVRAAFIGAFALGRGSSGVVRTAAELFGVGAAAASESSKTSVTKDGDLSACRNSKASDAAPPSQCESALRLELLPIAAEKLPEIATAQANQVPAAAPIENPCPAGMVRTGEKCAEPGKGPFQCNEDAPAVCEDQCKAGNAASCFNLAAMLNRGDKLPRDAERAKALFQKACDGGNADGCLYSAYSLNGQTDKPQREKYYGKACELGSAMACRVLGEDVMKDDANRGLSLLGRGCALADNFACGRLGFTYMFGRAGVPKDLKKGLEILEGSCERGNWRDCWDLGRFLTRCEASRGGLSKVDGDACSTFEAPDPVRGAIALERACNNGGVAACFEAGWFLHHGKGKSDLNRARMMYERACPSKSFNWDGCMALGEMYEKGEGVTADPARAVAYYEQVCTVRMLLGGKACVRAAGFYDKGKGVPKNPAKALELWGKACVDDGFLGSCETYGQMLEKAGRKDDARGMFKDKCLAMKDEALCGAYKRLGGTLPADFKTFPRRAGE